MIPATYVRIANFPCLSFKMHVHVFTEEFLPSNLLVRSTSTFYRYKLISSIFDKCSILEQMIWLWNHASHTKVHFNECVANVGHNHLGPPRLWRLLEAKNIISWRTLWHFNSTFGSSLSASSAYLRFTIKLSLSASFSLHISNSWTKPSVLDLYYTIK